MQWMVASTDSGLIYVLSYDPEVKLIRILCEHDDLVWSLAIHATEPYMLSGSDNGKTVLWNYEKNWEIINTFHAESMQLYHVTFNPKMDNMFATADYGRIQVWDDFIVKHWIKTPWRTLYMIS
jgi:WD40 repeat protein